jgi:hypothetical protein
MKKNILKIIFLTFLFQISCSPEDEDKQLEPFSTDPCELTTPTPDSLRYKAIYDKPFITLQDNSVFYANERIEINWSLPENLWNTELQFIESNKPIGCDEYKKFHQLNNDGYGYGNQYVHYYDNPHNYTSVQDSIFVSYRARSTDVQMQKGYSKWTDVKSFIIIPASDLNKETISATYSLDFITEEIDHFYYSGVTKVSNYRLLELANNNEINYDKIRFIRIVNFEVAFKTLMEDGQNPFSRLIIGFDENINPNETVYPFEPIGDIYPGSFQKSPILGSLYNNLDQNLTSVMKDYDLKVAYALEDEIGSQHKIDLHLTFEIYSEE